MKANRTTFLAIFCLCFFTISFGENATVQRNRSEKIEKGAQANEKEHHVRRGRRFACPQADLHDVAIQ